MITALNENKEIIHADKAIRGENYYCPRCEAPLIFRNGQYRIPHFAHKADGCGFGSGESLRHQELKLKVKELIESAYENSIYELEVSQAEAKIGDKFADYFFKDKRGVEVAIEIADGLSGDAIKEKTEYYSSRGVYTLWLYDHQQFRRGLRHNREFRVSKPMKSLHGMGYGHINTIDNDGFFAIHFDRVPRFSDSGLLYYLKDTKFLKSTVGNILYPYTYEPSKKYNSLNDKEVYLISVVKTNNTFWK